MNVSVRLVVVIGDGAEKREFQTQAHAYADPLEPSDPSWMIPDPSERGVSVVGVVRKLGLELAEAAAGLVGSAEVGSDAWKDDGAPRRLP